MIHDDITYIFGGWHWLLDGPPSGLSFLNKLPEAFSLGGGIITKGREQN